MYGYNAEPPIAIPIYTVLPYCVIACGRDVDLNVLIGIQVYVLIQKETRRCYGVLCEDLDFVGWKIERG